MKTVKFNKWFLLPVAAGALVIGGVALADDRDDVMEYLPVNQQPANAEFITEEEATKIANEKVDGEIVELYLYTDSRRAHFDVEMRDATHEYDFDIDAVTGDVYDFDKERLDDDDDRDGQDDDSSSSTVEGPILTKEEVLAIARKEVSSGEVTKFEQDDDHFEVEIRDGNKEYDFEIHKVTGDVLEFEQDDDDRDGE